MAANGLQISIVMLEFKQHPHYSNIICSSDGRVFTERKGWKRGGATGNNYLAIDWWIGSKNGKGPKERIIEYIHRLVAETFGEQIMGMDVDHQDFHPQHNAAGNLKASHQSDNRGRGNNRSKQP